MKTVYLLQTPCPSIHIFPSPSQSTHGGPLLPLSYAALHDVKQKTDLRSLLLEKRLDAATSEAERQSITLSEIVGYAMRLDPSTAAHVDSHLASVVQSKDEAISRAQSELGFAAARHDALIEGCLARMRERGIAASELGFVPLLSNEIVDTIATVTSSTSAAQVSRNAAASTVGALATSVNFSSSASAAAASLRTSDARVGKTVQESGMLSAATTRRF